VNPEDFLSDSIRWSNEQPPPEDIPTGGDMDPHIIGGDWRSLLHKAGKNEAAKPVLINADIALRYSPEWQGVLSFDEFKQKIVVTSTPPIIRGSSKYWTDEDDTRAAIWMQANGIYVGKEIVGTAIYSIAKEKSVHPVREYLQSLKWDGTPRLETWLETYMGATGDARQKVLYRSSGPKWMISAVARILREGCKADHMLIFEGAQGTRKSTALSILASQDWFCDQLPDLHNKDSSLQVIGSWIIEWAELDAMRRSDTTATKAFITRQVEKIRPPYGKHLIDIPRQCVFAGTTNKDDYLVDETGNRRFWPVKCGQVDTEALARDRDQLWAEAKFLFDEGRSWWLDTDEEKLRAGEEQCERVETDPWHEKIQEYVERNELQPNFSCEEILDNAIKLDTARQSIMEKRRVGRVMRELKFTYKNIRESSGTVKRFCR